MPIDGSDGGAASLFLFAHQDDEFGAFAAIAAAAVRGPVTCVYLTDGAAGGDPERRDAESRAVLARLGVPATNVHCVGRARGIADGRLVDNLDRVAAVVGEHLDGAPTAQVYVAAWEGGHPDHDGLHAVTTVLLQRRGRLADGRQFPLYHGHRRRGPFFRVLSPLAANGPVTSHRLPLGARLRQLRLCLSYPSQAKTWCGLFPFVATRILFAGNQALQPLSLARLDERPHDGPLYYERRGFATFAALQAALSAWRAPVAPS